MGKKNFQSQSCDDGQADSNFGRGKLCIIVAFFWYSQDKLLLKRNYFPYPNQTIREGNFFFYFFFTFSYIKPNANHGLVTKIKTKLQLISRNDISFYLQYFCVEL